jgi:hypothetical protein
VKYHGKCEEIFKQAQPIGEENGTGSSIPSVRDYE